MNESEGKSEWARCAAEWQRTAKPNPRCRVVPVVTRWEEEGGVPITPERPGRRLWALLGIVATLVALLLWPAVAWLCG